VIGYGVNRTIGRDEKSNRHPRRQFHLSAQLAVRA
jgi:hypothetical protein